jgi:hypothetical protein
MAVSSSRGDNKRPNRLTNSGCTDQRNAWWDGLTALLRPLAEGVNSFLHVLVLVKEVECLQVRGLGAERVFFIEQQIRRFLRIRVVVCKRELAITRRMKTKRFESGIVRTVESEGNV